MSSAASTSDWECIGDTKAGEEGKEEEETQTVVVEVPGGVLLSFGNSLHRSCDQLSETPSARVLKGVGNLCLSSASIESQASTSFVKVSGTDCAIDKTAWKQLGSKPDDASWSFLSSRESLSTSGWSTPASAAPSSASSMVSYFNRILLNGEDHRKCRLCKYINSETATICGGCVRALVPNPCVDQDEQIARNQQDKEEEYSLLQLRLKEEKLKNIHTEPPLEQGSFLFSEIKAAARLLGEHFESMDVTLREGPSVFLTSQFIEVVRRQGMERTISIKYVLTPSDRLIHHHLRCNGLRDYELADDVLTATLLYNQSLMTKSGGSLCSVPEHNHPSPFPAMAWLVAAVESQSMPIVQIETGLDTGSKALKAPFEGQVLPLASFPVNESVVAEEDLNRAAKLLDQVCQDVFRAEYEQEFSTDGDEALAIALQESLNEQAGFNSSSPPCQKKQRVSLAGEEEKGGATASIHKNQEKGITATGIRPLDINSRPAFEVKSKELKDHFNRRGVYSGWVDWASCLPHGNGSMKYIDNGQIFNGEWDNGVFQGPLSNLPDEFAKNNYADFLGSISLWGFENNDGIAHQTDKPGDEASALPVTNNAAEKVQGKNSHAGSKLVPGFSMLGRRVQILRGSFEGHIGTVVSEASSLTHIKVKIETIRTHTPTVMITQDNVNPVGGDELWNGSASPGPNHKNLR